MTGGYRPRGRIGCYPGCIGCSIPLLAALAAVVALVVMLT